MPGPVTKITVYGYLGWELQIESHIRTRMLFAIADEKRTKLAWYLFSQDMLLPKWHNDFEDVSMGRRKLDRNEVFASAEPGLLLLTSYDLKFAIDDVAPRIGRGAARASLDLHDEEALKTTRCNLYIDAVNRRGILLTFDMRFEKKRRTFDLRKSGRAFLFGVERFSIQALERGPKTQYDPYDPAW